jgi:hypothetical protein
LAAVAKLGIAADSYLSNAQRIISRSGVQIPPAACPRPYPFAEISARCFWVTVLFQKLAIWSLYNWV